MQEPRSRIIREESDGDIVTSDADVDNITTDGVDVVIGATARAANDVKVVL